MLPPVPAASPPPPTHTGLTKHSRERVAQFPAARAWVLAAGGAPPTPGPGAPFRPPHPEPLCLGPLVTGLTPTHPLPQGLGAAQQLWLRLCRPSAVFQMPGSPLLISAQLLLTSGRQRLRPPGLFSLVPETTSKSRIGSVSKYSPGARHRSTSGEKADRREDAFALTRRLSDP